MQDETSPERAEQVERAAPVSQPQARPQHAVHVLIVDDDPALRKMLAEIAAMEGFPVIGGAAHGAEALPILRDSPTPLIVFLGYIMPVMNGVEMLRHLALDPLLLRRHVFILQSGNPTFPDEVAKVMPKGLSDVPMLWMQKPGTVEQVVDNLTRAAERLA